MNKEKVPTHYLDDVNGDVQQKTQEIRSAKQEWYAHYYNDNKMDLEVTQIQLEYCNQEKVPHTHGNIEDLKYPER